VNAQIISATHNSAVLSYRLAWGLWLAVSLLDGAVYRHILSLDGGDTRVVRLALLFLVQAIWLPIYLPRKTFEGAAEAVICSAAAAVTFAGLASFLLGTITQLLGIPVSAAEDPRLQLGYVISILLARTFLRHIRVQSWELQSRMLQGIAEINAAPVVHRWKKFEAWTTGESGYVLVKRYTSSGGLGPFRRLWVMGWSEIEFVYPGLI
jgi:hypothetical protein